MNSIVPDLADSWTWSEDGTELTFKLHPGVKWHDGKPFTAKDVVCTWDLLQGKSRDGCASTRARPGGTTSVRLPPTMICRRRFTCKRPQPALLTLLASGYSPVYPCHVPPAQMRLHPIGTGPFKFVDYKPNEYIKVRRNPDYWKQGRPYLDGIEYIIVPNRSTAILGFIAGQFDMTWPFSVTIPLLKDIKTQAPQANCQLATNNGTVNLLINRDKPPFDNPDLRKALALSLDRKAFVDDPHRRQGQDRRRHAAAARGPVGHAAGNAGDDPRLRRRRREEPRRGARDHEKAGLRTG